MNQVIFNTHQGMLIYRLDEIHVCTLVETGPDTWDLVCCSGKKSLGSYTRARKLTDDFVRMLDICFLRLPEMRSSSHLLRERFEEFVQYRMVG